MISPGKIQKMTAARRTSFGIYLNPLDDPDHEGILLPNKYVSDETDIGEEVSVFVYYDSEGRLIATSSVPRLQAGQIGMLKAVSVTDFGAFLDWGLDKDLLLPKIEQTCAIEVGENYLVYVDIDRKGKIYASMNIQNRLEPAKGFFPDDRVEGIVYKIVPGIGAFTAIDNKYIGLIPNKELFRKISVGDRISARVCSVKKDGKIDLTVRDRSYVEIDADSQKIYEYLTSHGGSAAFNDKSPPELIKEVFGISKASFKRAVGKLLKEGRIRFEGPGISLIDQK